MTNFVELKTTISGNQIELDLRSDFSNKFPIRKKAANKVVLNDGGIAVVFKVRKNNVKIYARLSSFSNLLTEIFCRNSIKNPFEEIKYEIEKKYTFWFYNKYKYHISQ